MTRARELANFADDTAGLETLTVSDITDLSVSASNINSATNQITDSSTDLNVDSNTLVVDKSTNNVGIGDTSPSEKLVVSDNTASQFASVIKNTHASGAGMKVFGGTGTQYSFIVRDYNDSTNSLVVLGNGNVGIGTTSPAGDLHISESGASEVRLQITNSNTGHTASDGFAIVLDAGATNQYFWNYEARDMVFGINNTQKMKIGSSGNVNISGISAGEQLTLDGGSGVDSGYIGWRGNGAHIGFIGGGAGVGASAGDFVVRGQSNIKLNIGGSTKAILDSSGKFGIGTSSPTEILHLADHGGSTAPAIEFTNSANSRGLEIRATFSGDYASFLTTGGSTAGFEFGLSNGTSYLRLDNFGRLLRGDASAFSSLPSISTSGFSSVSSLYVDAVFVSGTSYYVRVFFTFTNTSGSSKSFRVNYGRNTNGVNFSHRILNTLEYNSQSIRHYEGFVATATANGTIFSSASQELVAFQGSSGTWSTSGGTGNITWTEASSFGDGVEGGVVYELLLARAASSRVTSISFEAV